MPQNTEHLSEIHRKNMEAAMRLVQLSIDNSQRIMSLQNELAKTLFDESVANAKALAEVKTPQEVIALRTQYAQDTSKRMMDAARQITEIGSEVRAEFSHLLTEQLASGSQELIESFQSLMSALPGSNPSIVTVMQQALASANSAFEQITKASTAAFAGMSEAHKGARKK